MSARLLDQFDISDDAVARLVRETMDVLRGLADDLGIGLLVAEQNVREATRLADRVYVLRRGAVVHHGPASELLDGDGLWELF